MNARSAQEGVHHRDRNITLCAARQHPEHEVDPKSTLNSRSALENDCNWSNVRARPCTTQPSHDSRRTMIKIQVIPRSGADAYRLVLHKVTHEAKTWSWANKRKTRLVHKQFAAGYIAIDRADDVLTAEVHAKEDQFFLVEKFIGRLVAWFPEDLHSINLQFLPESRPVKGK